MQKPTEAQQLYQITCKLEKVLEEAIKALTPGPANPARNPADPDADSARRGT